ncbi:MAG TPA: 4'-phosphopantetheinyl transferase superfamily protein [Streptosporangiaceae bacterium]|nr:4'-phosphopantetheinyl transferase superfamily protein [Streptosporangiaceae bacterium]
MLATIVSSGVEVAEVFGDRCDHAALLAGEEAAIRGAAPKRRREFTAVRACARRALARAGFQPVPILPGPSGAPVWPPGVVGSMTHCDGYRACAIGRAELFAAIGIDAEPHDVLPDGVLSVVASDSERSALAVLAAQCPGICWERILFSAKESVFKAWFPATGRWLGFTGAEVIIDLAGTFAASLLVPGPVVGGSPLTTYHGRWVVERGLIATAVVVPADTRADPAGAGRAASPGPVSRP